MIELKNDDVLKKCLDYVNSYQFEEDVNQLKSDEFYYLDSNDLKLRLDPNVYCCNKTILLNNKKFIKSFRKKFLNIYNKIVYMYVNDEINFNLSDLKSHNMTLNLLSDDLIIKFIDSNSKFNINLIPLDRLNKDISRYYIQFNKINVTNNIDEECFNKIFNYDVDILPDKLSVYSILEFDKLNLPKLNTKTFKKYIQLVSKESFLQSNILKNISLDVSNLIFILPDSSDIKKEHFKRLKEFDKIVIHTDSSLSRSFLYSLTKEEIDDKILISDSFFDCYDSNSKKFKNIFKNCISNRISKEKIIALDETGSYIIVN